MDFNLLGLYQINNPSRTDSTNVNRIQPVQPIDVNQLSADLFASESFENEIMKIVQDKN